MSESLSSKKHVQISFDKIGYYDSLLVLFATTPPSIYIDAHTGEDISYPLIKVRNYLSTTLHYPFVVSHHKICDVGPKLRALKAKQDSSFWSSVKYLKLFSKIDDLVKYFLQKLILSHPHLIQYPIANDFIQVDMDDGNGLTNMEVRQKVLFKVPVRELHMEMKNKYSYGFPWHVIK